MSMYSHAVVLRSDRVDYSVTKGGIRLWTTLLLFFLLMGGLANFMADTEDLVKLENALDFDGDGDHDNVDDDEGDVQIHADDDEGAERKDPLITGLRQRRRGSAGEQHEQKDSSEEQEGSEDDEDEDTIDDSAEVEDPDEGGEDYEAELLASIGRHRPGSGYDNAEDHTAKDIPPPVRYERRKGRLPPAPKVAHEDSEPEDFDDDDTNDHDGFEEEGEEQEEPEPKPKPFRKKRVPAKIESDEFVPDPSKPIKFVRTHGLLPKAPSSKYDESDAENDETEDDIDSEARKKPHAAERIRKLKILLEKMEEEEAANGAPDPSKPVRYFRTKGSLPTASHRDDRTTTHNQDHDRSVNETVPSCSKDADTPTNRNPAIRFKRIKGPSPVKTVHSPHPKPQLELRSAAIPELKTETAVYRPPDGPVRFFRTKGTLPKIPEKHTPQDIVQTKFEGDVLSEKPLRYYRTKGVLPSHAPRKMRTFSQNKETLPSKSPKPTVPPAESQPDVEKRVEKNILSPPPLRYYRTKGALPSVRPRKMTCASREMTPSRDVTMTSSRDVTERVSKPPVRYYRTKGVKRGQGVGATGYPENVSGPPSQATLPAAQARSRDTPASADADAGVTQLASVSSSYRKSRITNRDDNKIRSFLDEADRLLEQNFLEEALEKFRKLTETYKRSPRAQFGYAKTMERLADKKQSNQLLEECITAYEKVLTQPYVPDDLYLLTVERLVDRSRFRGWMDRAALAQSQLVDRFPDRLHLRNGHGVTFLMMGRNEDAKRVFADVLRKDPTNGFAQAHYGFIIKTVDNDLENGAAYLAAGIASGQDGTHDGRFYFHLGEALQRLGRRDEAYEVYKAAADNDIFLSALQRSLHNVEHLTGKPWRTAKETGYSHELKAIERHWKVIKEEGIHLMKKRPRAFVSEDQKLIAEGKWKQLPLFRRGRRMAKNCGLAPQTCEIVGDFQEAANCTRGHIKFSILEGGSRVHPHCGPTNCRLRGMLGLIVPAQPRIRVGNETRGLEAGKFVIFDDSFEHELWNNGKELLLTLVVDFWHPELSERERRGLEPL